VKRLSDPRDDGSLANALTDAGHSLRERAGTVAAAG
jgi:hypothetical protein